MSESHSLVQRCSQKNLLHNLSQMTDPNLVFEDLFDSWPEARQNLTSTISYGHPEQSTNVSFPPYGSIIPYSVECPAISSTPIRNTSGYSVNSSGRIDLSSDSNCSTLLSPESKDQQLSRSAPAPCFRHSENLPAVGRPMETLQVFGVESSNNVIHDSANSPFLSTPQSVILARRSADDAADYGPVRQIISQSPSASSRQMTGGRDGGSLAGVRQSLTKSATGRRTQSMCSEGMSNLIAPSSSVYSGDSDFSCSTPSSPLVDVVDHCGKSSPASKLERSRQSARDCRVRKKLRYQYLAGYNSHREKSNQQMYSQLSNIVDMAHQFDAGLISANEFRQFLVQQ